MSRIQERTYDNVVSSWLCIEGIGVEKGTLRCLLLLINHASGLFEKRFVGVEHRSVGTASEAG